MQGIGSVPNILRILCETTGMGFAAVARVTETDWTACAVLDQVGFGMVPGDGLEIATTFCTGVHKSGVPVVIHHASEEPAFCNHPSPKRYGFESYVSIPITLRDGCFFGTMCALDPRPTPLALDRLLPTLGLFAELLASHIELAERLDRSQSALLDAEALGALREQFIAVLGHDLRNPIAAVQAGLQLLERQPQQPRATTVIGQMKQSCRRMTELVNNLLDLARGRLGGGIGVQRQPAVALEPVLVAVVEELRSAHPGRVVETGFALDHPIACDPQRISQLLSNLLANALVHGAADQPVQVAARSNDAGFLLTVTNRGPTIPPALQARLFQPFVRAGEGQAPGGLGLGLYIAAEVARSHGGTLDVHSADGETRFTLHIPAG